MKRGWLINIALLVAVALLTWLALRAPSREEAARAPLSAVKPAAVSRITLTRPARPAITIERRGEQWWMTAPFKARADEFQILRMLSILEAQATAQLPANDRTRFELEPPSAVLDIDGVQYAFGGINAVTREQYVLRSDVIHAVELRHGAGLPLKSGDTGIVRTLWMSLEEMRQSHERHRSRLLIQCAEDHAKGMRYPLETIYTDATVFNGGVLP